MNPKTEEAYKHKLKKIEAKKASVDADGNIEYYICESCGRFFADKNGQKEIKKSQVTSEKRGSFKEGGWNFLSGS